MTRDYKKIIAWQRAHQLTLRIYKETKIYPHEERYGLECIIQSRSIVHRHWNMAEKILMVFVLTIIYIAIGVLIGGKQC